MKPEDTAAEEASPAIVMQDAPTPELAEGKWDRVIIVAGGGRAPANVGARKVIVTEHRAPSSVDDGGQAVAGELKTKGYASGADAYYRTDESVEFSAGEAPVFTLAQNIRPSGVGGFSSRGLRTGPGHPAYAAANLAHQQGAKDIEIVGLSKADQETLQIWFDSPKMPQGVKVHFS